MGGASPKGAPTIPMVPMVAGNATLTLNVAAFTLNLKENLSFSL
jgi:hypothetical protein